MKTVSVRNVEIGSGIPKICVPIIGISKEDIFDEVKRLDGIHVDIVEWRIDYFENAFDHVKVEEILKKLRGALGDTPILMTFRTSKEGGEKSIEPDDYVAINIKAAETGYIDIVDVEAFAGDDVVKKIITGAHNAGVKVIASNHDFDKTPDKNDIISRLYKMQSLGADISKIAVMPTNKYDVLTLLTATAEMYRDYADRPIVTVSMGKLGAISRLCGEAFGSAITFGAVEKASSPGQLEARDLSFILTLLHNEL